MNNENVKNQLEALNAQVLQLLEELNDSDNQDDGVGDYEMIPIGDFSVSKYEITNYQYQKFVRDTGHRAPSHWVDGEIPDGLNDHPVVNVNYFDAKAYCEWAGGRLPTSDEWSEAAGNGEYPWGDEDPTEKHANFNMNIGTTSPVNQYPLGASSNGIHDMSGNVWEWTSTKYEE